MAQSAGKTFNFSCRAKQDTFNVSGRILEFRMAFIFRVGPNPREIRHLEDQPA